MVNYVFCECYLMKIKREGLETREQQYIKLKCFLYLRSDVTLMEINLWIDKNFSDFIIRF